MSLITAILYFPLPDKIFVRKQDKMADIKGCQSQIETLRYNCMSLMSTPEHVRILLPMNCRSQITAKKFKEASKTLIQIKVSVHLQITNIPYPHRNHIHTGNWLSMQLSNVHKHILLFCQCLQRAINCIAHRALART